MVFSGCYWVMFGFSNFFGDIYDIVLSGGERVVKVVVNVPEKVVPGRPRMEEYLKRLAHPVDVVPIDEFRRGPAEKYVIGFTRKAMEPLIARLNADHGISFHTLIHKQAIVQCGALYREGVVLDAGAILGPWSRVGRHVVMSRGATIGHDATVGDYSFLGAGAVLCGHVRIGQNVLVGANATVIPDVTVGDDVVIAAGAVVTKDVPAGTMVAGVPAQVKKVIK